MAKTYYDHDADLSLIQAKKVAIIGYGSQGHAHALNLKDSGVQVKVGLAPTPSPSPRRRRPALKWTTVADVDQVGRCGDGPGSRSDRGQVVCRRDRAESDGRQAADVRARLQHPLQDHCSAPRASTWAWPRPRLPAIACAKSSPKAAACPASSPSHQDATGNAHALCLSYLKGIGGTRAGVLETTFKEETETDLFGEQSVLCGGVSALIKAGFETLVEAGYQPESAYFECLHELKLIVDLIYRGGLAYMRYSISDTAEWGDYVSGPRVINDESRKAMKQILTEIQNGEFAKRFLADQNSGRKEFMAFREAEAKHPVEIVGKQLRAAMPFLDPVTVEEVAKTPVVTSSHQTERPRRAISAGPFFFGLWRK